MKYYKMIKIYSKRVGIYCKNNSYSTIIKVVSILIIRLKYYFQRSVAHNATISNDIKTFLKKLNQHHIFNYNILFFII